MILKLEMPSVNRMIGGGKVVRWHKKEGEWVDYGDLLVDIDGRLKPAPSHQIQRPGPYPFAIVSSDRGRLKAIRALEGSSHGEGDVLAVLESGETAYDPIDDAVLESAIRFRVTVNLYHDCA